MFHCLPVNDHEDYSPDEEDRPPDPAVGAAAGRLREFFEAQPHRLFYSTQIATHLEREFFHWITGKALLQLAQAQEIQRNPAEVEGNHVNFYAHRRHRYWRREQREMIGLLQRLFNPEFAQAVGRHGELMFDAALGRQGFRAEARDTRSWQGKTWEHTDHNLDRIISRDGIIYGVEIKNTQNYISRTELRTKLSLCQHLEIIPLFIMRFAPKSYVHEVIQAGGVGARGRSR